MDTLVILYHSLKPNIIPISEILGFFLITSSVGYVIYSAIFKVRSWFILLPASGLIGVFGFILFLSFFSYLFKGPGGILCILFFYVLFGFGLFVKVRNIVFPDIDFSKSNFIWLLASLVFLSLFFLIAGINIYGGDVIAYWGFATSFANGNYPVYSPWQPDLLAAHHQGAFLYQGAIYSLIRVNMRLIHSLFAFFIVSGGFFFLWGWMRSQLRSTVGGLIVALVFYFAFSAIFIVLPVNFQNLFQTEVTHEIATPPRFIDAKNRLGGSSNLNEIFYLNHRAAAFGGLFLIIYLMSTQIAFNEKWKYPLLAILTIVVMSIDEVVLPAIGTAGLYYFVNHLINQSKQERRRILTFAFLSLIGFIFLFLVVGSALRDAILIPSDVPRFKLLLGLESIILRGRQLMSNILTFPNLPVMVYMPHLLISALAATGLTYKLKDKIGTLFLVAAFGSMIAFFVVEHTFYPGNEGRFLHLIYLLVITALSYSLIKLFLKIGLKSKLIVGFLIFFLFGGSTVSSAMVLFEQVKAQNYPNYQSKIPEYQPVFSWMQQYAPQKRIFFMDGYLKGVSYSHLSIVGIQDYGLMVPVSPAFIKVHTPDFGVEAMDLILTLNPRDIAALKVDYLYIQKDQLALLSLQRLNDLKNTSYFKKVYHDEFGELYLVKSKYRQEGINEDLNSIYGLTQIIGENKKVYLDYPPGIEMGVRQVLWLALKNQDQVYTYWSSGIFNYIETPMIRYSPNEIIKYDYVIIGSSTDPLTVCNCQNYDKVWQLSGVIAYKVN